MIQFNLLPDVKLEYIKATRRKRLVMISASSLIALSLTILIILFVVVNVVQKRHLSNLSATIEEGVKELQETPDLDKILTVQNQLMRLTELHDKKPVASRLFKYLAEVTPTNINISKLDINFETFTIELSGSSDDLNNINTFVDTLKFTDFTVAAEPVEGEEPAQPETKRAFGNVVLSSFGRTSQEASFSIDLIFDPLIFDTLAQVNLVVPEGITTRSNTERPGADLSAPTQETPLFEEQLEEQQ